MTTTTIPSNRHRRAQDRRHIIIALRLENPTLSLREIGVRAGYSGERVRQVLKEMGMPTRHKLKNPKYCHHCGKPSRLKFCSPQCRQAAKKMITVVCDACGAPIQKAAWLEKSNLARGYRHHFCNRHCMGKWLSQHRRQHRQKLHANAFEALALLLKAFLQSVFPLQCTCGREIFYQDYIGPEDIKCFITKMGLGG